MKKLIILIFILTISSINICTATEENAEKYNVVLKYEYTIALSKAMGLNEKIMKNFNENIDTGSASRYLLPNELKYLKKYLLSIYNVLDERIYNNFKHLKPENSINDIYPILESELCFLNIPYESSRVIEISMENGLAAQQYDEDMPKFTYENVDVYLQNFLNKKVYYYFDENGNLQINYNRDYTYADLYCERNGIKDKDKITYSFLMNNPNIYATRGDAISIIAKSIGVNDRIFNIESHIMTDHPLVEDAYLMDENDVYASLLGKRIVYGDGENKHTIYAMPERKVTVEEVYTFMLRCLEPTEYNTIEGAKHYNLLINGDRWYNNLNQVITLDELNIINERFLDNKAYYCFVDKVPYDGDDFYDCFDYIINKYDCTYRDLKKLKIK